MEPREYARMFEAEDTHWWYLALHELVMRYVRAERELKGAPLELLDAGCGTGGMARLLGVYGSVSAMDCSPHAVGFCRERGISGVGCADLNIDDIGAGRYDVIVSLDVLYHKGIEDDALVTGKFHRALRHGGALILNLPAFEFLRGGHDVAVHTGRRYTRAGLKRMLVETGFDVVLICYRMGFLFPFLVLFRPLQRLVLKARGVDEPDSDVSVPPGAINRALLALGRMENRLIETRIAPPFGTSVFAVARKRP